MRDLHAQGVRVPVAVPELVNGDEPRSEDALGQLSPRFRARVAARDQSLAEMVVFMIDSVKMVEPVVGMISGGALRWATLSASVWLSFYALQHAASNWERLAVVAAFMVCSIPIWWKRCTRLHASGA